MKTVRIFVICTLAVLFFLPTASLAAPTRAILLVYDTENGDSMVLYEEAMAKLKSMRDGGQFAAVKGLSDRIAAYDFAKNGAYLQRLRIGDRDKVPRIAIVELEGGVPSKVVWGLHFTDSDAAAASLMENLGQSYAAKPVPSSSGGDTITNPKDGTVLVKVPAGPFVMGSDDRSDQKPPHRVSLPTYYIGRTEVTNAQFRKFVNATGYNAGDDWKEYARKWGEKAPVVYVTWNDANAYCRWAGLRLPTEQEWEKAARGTDGRTYPWGNSFDASRVWYDDNSNSQAHPVGSRPGDVSPYGALDMAGNAGEWTASWYQAYPGGAWKSDYGTIYKVSRGGHWGSGTAGLSCTYRYTQFPTFTNYFFGFRCAWTP